MNSILQTIISYFFICCCSLPIWSQEGFHLKENKRKSRIPFELVNNLPIVKVNINGTDFSFILDTGVKSTLLFSTESVSDFSMNETVPVQIQGLGSNGSIAALKSKNNKIQVGNAVDNNHELYLILDSSLNFSPRMGVPINGILGNDFFQNFIVKINYSSKKVIIYDPKTYALKECKKCEDLPLDFKGGKPYINLIASDGKTNNDVTLLIDSGSSDVLWLFDEGNYIREQPKNYFQDFLGLGLGGNIFGKRAQITELILGNFHLINVNTSFPEQSATTTARLFEDRSGSLGGGFLSRFDIIFDYGNQIVRFKKNRRFKDPFYYNMSGLTIEHSGMDWLIDDLRFTLVPRFVVVDVREGSPAQLAGVQKDDEVLAINGKPNYRYKLYELIDLFSKEEGYKITLIINRGGVTRKFKFYLQRVL